MIVVNGTEYRTLADELMVNGRKVYEAYVNDKLVYPEPYDSRYTYIVAEGTWSGDLSETTVDDFWSENIGTSVEAEVTWILKLIGSDISIESSYNHMYANVSELYNPSNTRDVSKLIDCWNIVKLDVSDSCSVFKDHTKYANTDRVYDEYEVKSVGTASQTSGEYSFKRLTYGSGTINLLNYGDLGWSSKVGRFGYGPPYSDDDYRLESIPSLQVYLSTYGNAGTVRDLVVNFNSNTSLSIVFNDMQVIVGNLLEETLKKVYISSYTESDAPYVHHNSEWIDVETDWSTRIDHNGNVRYSNDGEIVHRYTFNDQPAKPQLLDMRRIFNVRADNVKVYMPGDELPEKVAGIDSVDYYDSRELYR